MPTLDKIVGLLLIYRYLLLFPIAVIEGPIISVIAGFMSSQGYFNFIIAYLVLAFGDITGDTLYYGIGRWGGRPFIHRFGKYFGLDEKKVVAMERHFHEHGGRTLAIAKTQAIGSIILVSAGLSKMHFPKFVWVNTLGTLVKTALLFLIGFYFGQAYKIIDSYIKDAGIILTVAAVLAVALYIFYTRPKKA